MNVEEDDTCERRCTSGRGTTLPKDDPKQKLRG